MIPDRERHSCGCCARRMLWCWRRRLLCPGVSEPLQANADEPPAPLATQPQGAQGVIEKAQGGRETEQAPLGQCRPEEGPTQITQLIRGSLEEAQGQQETLPERRRR